MVQRCFHKMVLRQRLRSIKLRAASELAKAAEQAGFTAVTSRGAVRTGLRHEKSAATTAVPPEREADKVPVRAGSSAFVPAGRQDQSSRVLELAGKNDVLTILNLGESVTPKEIVVKDERGNTALHYACINNNPDLARVLLNLGADADVANSSGETPLAMSRRLGRAKVSAVC